MSYALFTLSFSLYSDSLICISIIFLQVYEENPYEKTKDRFHNCMVRRRVLQRPVIHLLDVYYQVGSISESVRIGHKSVFYKFARRISLFRPFFFIAKGEGRL